MPTIMNTVTNLRACKERDNLRGCIKAACDRMVQAEDDGDDAEMLHQAQRITELARNLAKHAEVHGL